MVYIIYGFILGILTGSFLFPTLSLIGAFFIFAIIIHSAYVKDKSSVYLLYTGMVLLGLSLGLFRIHFSDLHTGSRLAPYENKTIVAEGIIVSEPDIRESATKLTIKITKIGDEKITEKIVVSVPLYPEFHYGDKVSVQTVIKQPENRDNDGRTFDYIGYLRARGVWYQGLYSKVAYIESGHGSIIKTYLFSIKQRFTTSIQNAIPSPQSDLLAGLLLGTKQTLGTEWLDKFSRTGVSHIVVLSGYNIAIVGESIVSFFAFLPQSISFLIGVFGIICFTILSGGSASAVRAAIMVLVALFAKRFNREYKAHRAFGFAIVLMLTPNPLLLVFDPSFQLSALATIGLIYVSPIIEPYFHRIPERFGLREITCTTVATQCTVVPYLLYSNGLLSLVALPVNVLILGTIPITMFLGFIVGMSGLLSLWLSFIPALPTYLLLSYQLTVVSIGSSLSSGIVTLPSFSIFILGGMYLGIGYGLYVLKQKHTTT